MNLLTKLFTTTIIALILSSCGDSNNNPITTGSKGPVIAPIDAQQTDEDAPLQIPLSASDANGNTLTFKVTILDNTPPLVTVAITETATVNGTTTATLLITPLADKNGTANILVDAIDSAGVAARPRQFMLTVTPVNDAPVANRTTDTATVLRSVGTVVRTADQVQSYFTDVDGDTLTYNIATGNGSGTFAINTATGVTTVVALNAVATYMLAITARDNGGLVATTTLTVNVTNALPPTLENGATQTVVVNITPINITFGAVANIANCTVLPVLPGLDVDDNTCRITGISSATQTMTTHIVTAENSTGQTATASVSLTVNAPAPILASITTTQTAVVGSLTPITFANTGGTVTMCVAPNLPDGLKVEVNNTTCRITGTPTLNGTQTAMMHTVTATNSTGQRATATVSIIVNDIAPMLTIVNGADQVVVAGGAAITNITFGNTGGGMIASCRTNSDLPSGLFINNTTCMISGTVHVIVTATAAAIRVIATNATGQMDIVNVSITINQLTPTLENGATQTVLVNTPITTPITFDNTGVIATCAMTPVLINLLVNDKTCTITGTPKATQTATTHTVTATNKTGQRATATVSITVNENTVTIAANQTFSTVENAEFSRTIDSGGTNRDRSLTILSGNTGGVFTIAPGTDGTDVLRAGENTLNFETTPTFSLTVQATGLGAITKTATIIINVTNLNENMITIVANQTRTITETLTIGSNVGAILVTTGTPTGFAISGDNFDIDNTGQITNRVALNSQSNSTYSPIVTITKADATTKTATITINVTEDAFRIRITSADSIVARSSLTLTAEVLPSGVTHTAVAWSIPDTGSESSGAPTISGDVITASFGLGVFVITARATATATGDTATATQTFSVIPVAPATLTAVATGVRNQVRIAWAAVPRVDSYTLYSVATDSSDRSLSSFENRNTTNLGIVDASKTDVPVGTSMTFTLGTQTVFYLVTATQNGAESFTNSTQTAATAFDMEFGTTVPSPDTSRVWMDRNLGASQVATGSTDTMAYGDLYQWGRGNSGYQKIDRTTAGNCFNGANKSVTCTSLITTDLATDIAATNVSGVNFITTSGNDWLVAGDDSGARRSAMWGSIDGSSICPTGFNVPTTAELVADTVEGTDNNHIIDAATAFRSFLRVSAAGFRSNSGGSLGSVNRNAAFWSRSADGGNPTYIRITPTANAAQSTTGSRAFGFSIRCIRAN